MVIHLSIIEFPFNVLSDGRFQRIIDRRMLTISVVLTVLLSAVLLWAALLWVVPARLRGVRSKSPREGEEKSAEADRAIRTLVDGSGTSFFWAMRLLEAPRRRAMFAVYAFCRVVDDIADEGGTAEEKQAGLAEWRGEIERIFQGRPEHPVGIALSEAVSRFGLRKEDMHAVVDGMNMDAVMDASDAVRAPSMADLDLYCDRVASAVGRLSCRVFGLPEAEGDRLAHSLGRALQLTNILRDLAEDAERGRLYLPRELLEAHGMTDLSPSAVLAHPMLPAVCAELGGIAERHYADARAILDVCDKHKRRPAAIMMAVYHRLHERMTEAGWRTPATPPRLSKAEKIAAVLRALLLGP